MTDEIALLLKKIDGIEAQAASLKEILVSLDVEVEKWASKRDSLNQRRRKIREEIRHFKTRRDQLNQRIKELKARREDLRSGLEEKYREYNLLKKKVESLGSETLQSEVEVRRQIESLDWKIQTNSLTLSEENQIINQIRTLEQQRIVHKEISSLERKMMELRLAIATVKLQCKGINDQIISSAKESQEMHIQMLEKIKGVDAIKAEADQVHQRFLEYVKKAQENRSTYLEYIKQLEDLTSQINQIEEKKRRLVADTESEAQSRTATKKLMEKKKMSLEEFKALMEKGLV